MEFGDFAGNLSCTSIFGKLIREQQYKVSTDRIKSITSENQYSIIVLSSTLVIECAEKEAE